jgi:hypothetical protein
VTAESARAILEFMAQRSECQHARWPFPSQS